MNPSVRSAKDPSIFELNITGTSLELAQGVKLVKGALEIPATGVVSNPSHITCQVNLGHDPQVGKWDVVATMSDGKIAKLPEAFEMSATAPPTTPTVTALSPTRGAAAGGDYHRLGVYRSHGSCFWEYGGHEDDGS